MSVLFAYMAGGEGIRGFKMFFFRGGQNFFYLLRVCVGGGAGVRFSTSPSVKEITDPPLINK